MAEWPIHILAPVALTAFFFLCAIVYLVFRNPVNGVYVCFFSTSILLAPSLPLVREKLTITELFIVITWIAMLARWDLWHYREKSLSRGQRNVILLGWTFTIWIVASFSLKIFAAIGVPSESVDLEGGVIESVNFIYGFLLFRTVIALIDDWKKLQNCLLAWLAGAAVVSMVGIWAAYGGAPIWAYEEHTMRVSSTLRNENQVASFLLPILPFAFFLITKRGTPILRRIFMMGIFGAAMLTLIATGSRTALVMLGILFLSVLLLLVKMDAGMQVIRRGHVFFAALMIGIASLFYIGMVLQQYEGDYSLVETPAWQRPVVLFYEWYENPQPLDANRENQIAFVLNHFMENPILGVGPKQTGPVHQMGEIHNTYLGVLLELGVPGLLIFLSWLVGSFILARGSLKKIEDPEKRIIIWALLVGLVLIAIYNGTMFGLRQRNIWLLTGLMVAIPRLKDIQLATSVLQEKLAGHLRGQER